MANIKDFVSIILRTQPFLPSVFFLFTCCALSVRAVYYKYERSSHLWSRAYINWVRQIRHNRVCINFYDVQCATNISMSKFQQLITVVSEARAWKIVMTHIITIAQTISWKKPQQKLSAFELFKLWEAYSFWVAPITKRLSCQTWHMSRRCNG